MLIPIGRDETIVRRHPWVSYSVIALNVVAFFFLNVFAARPNETALNEKFTEIIALLEQHPYLRVPPDLKRILPDDVENQLADYRREARERGTFPPRGTLDREQKQLDALSDELSALTDTLPRRLAYVPARGSIGTMFSSMFVHADFFHLLGNLLFFFATAPFLEDVFGIPLFTFLYFSGGCVATSVYALHFPDSTIPLVGASGAIAAVMGAYMVRFLRSRTEFLWMPLWFVPKWRFRFFVPAYVLFPLWFVLQWYFAVNASEGSGVAFWAHVGGFLYGVAIAVGMKLTGAEEKYINPAIESKISWSQDPRVVRAGEARSRGDLIAASREIAAVLHENGTNVDARREAWDIAVEAEDWESAATHGLRLIESFVQQKEHGLVIETARDAIERGGKRLPIRFYQRIAVILAAEGERDWAADLYDYVADNTLDAATAIRALVRKARIERAMGKSDAARETLARAGRHPGCEGELRQFVDAELHSSARAPLQKQP
jgi:membrane associated rhomboid family serine protease